MAGGAGSRGPRALGGGASVRALRRRGSILPILMLTARGTIEARVEGLSVGADDYLPKPFEIDNII